VRRQMLYFAKMDLPDDVEIILVDDGSSPQLVYTDYAVKNLHLYYTHNKLAWTQGLGRNLGAHLALGEYLLMTDIDHILSRQAIEDVRGYSGPKMIFRRQIALLDEQGNLTQDRAALSAWGYDKPSLDASVHGNTWAMPRLAFQQLGGYDPERSQIGYHPVSRQGDDCYFNAKWNHAFPGTAPDMGSDIYLFPTGRFHKDGDLNPHGLFHNLHHRQEVAQKGDES
jgi:glycosyltransferase involved in cell wall biosynthesis